MGMKLLRPSQWLAAVERMWPLDVAFGIRQGLHRAHIRMVDTMFASREPPGFFTDREWDHLLLLDACRHDTLEAVLGRPVPSIRSPGSTTAEWARRSVARDDVDLSDVVLVTANPHHSPEYFEMMGWPFPYRYGMSLWKDPFWDEEWMTVRPEVVTEVAREVASKGYRLLVHYVQPHFPPITEKLDIPGFTPARTEVLGEQAHDEAETIWTLISSGRVPVSRARALYEANLREVLRQVRVLAAELEGRVVVTSDHGNLFGEYGLWGHPGGLHVAELVNVPWAEVDETFLGCLRSL